MVAESPTHGRPRVRHDTLWCDYEWDMPYVPDILRLQESGPQDPYRWRLIGPLRYERADGSGSPIEAADGFETDLASVPRAMTWLIPRYGLYTKAAVIHDFECQHSLDRFLADHTFREAMAELGVPGLRRRLMWAAVTWATAAGYLLRHWRWTIAAGLVLAALVWVVPPFPGWSLWLWVALVVFVVALLMGSVAAIPQRRWGRLSIMVRAAALTIAGLPLLVPGLVLAVLLGAYAIVENPVGTVRSLLRWVTLPFRILTGAAEREAGGEDTPRARRLANLVQPEVTSMSEGRAGSQ